MEIHSDYRAESKIGQEGPHTKYIAPEVINESDPGKVMKERNAGATFADIYSLGMVFKDIKKHIGNSFKVALERKQAHRHISCKCRISGQFWVQGAAG